MTTSCISHHINIVSTETYQGIPQSNYVFNQYDEFGLLVGTNRLLEEANKDYKKRIYDTFINRANSTYRGLINGITRELGYSLFNPITINPKINPITQEFYCSDPYIKISESYIYLYSDYRNSILEYKIDRLLTGGNYEILIKLINFINTTTNWESSLIDTDYTYHTSKCLINQSNRETISIEELQQSTKNKLKNRHIVLSSVIFSDNTTFNYKVNNLSDIDRVGRYHIDLTNGIITTYRAPAYGSYIRYDYIKYPFKPIASPIILSNINSEDYQNRLFHQVLLESTEYTNGKLTELGVDIINELITISPMYWGI